MTHDALMLDVAYNFCLSMPTLPKLEDPNEAVVRKLNCKCTIWKNGIHCITSDGIQALVEVTEKMLRFNFIVSRPRAFH